MRLVVISSAFLLGSVAAYAQPLGSTQFTGSDGSVRASIFPAAINGSNPDLPPDEVMVGGVTAGVGGLLAVRGTPYSYDNAGALVTLDMTGAALTGSVAPINGLNSQSPDTMLAGYGELDAATIAAEADNMQPIFTATATSYDATHVTFATALTAAQAKSLRIGMYVTTNSINTAISTTHAAGTLPPVNYYVSTINGWTPNGDGTVSSLVVSGWVVPGSGTSTAAAPSTTSLDTVFSNYGTPTVMFGAMTKVFNGNFITQLRPHTGSNPWSLINQATGMEFDYFNFDPTDYHYALSILDANYDPEVNDSSGNPVLMAAGSHFEHVSGGWPTFMEFDHEAPTSVILSSTAHYLGGYAGTTTTGGNNWIMSEDDAYEDGAGPGRLVRSLRQISTAAGENGNEAAIEFYSGGKQNTTNGDLQGGLLFSPSGYQGGGCLESQYNRCGLAVNYGGAAFALNSLTINLGAANGNALTVNGAAAVTGAETVGGALRLENVALASLPTGCFPGQEVYVTDGRNPSEASGAGTGTVAFCNKNAAWLATTTGVAVTH